MISWTIEFLTVERKLVKLQFFYKTFSKIFQKVWSIQKDIQMGNLLQNSHQSKNNKLAFGCEIGAKKEEQNLWEVMTYHKNFFAQEQKKWNRNVSKKELKNGINY